MTTTNLPIILSIDTSCDETSAAVTRGTTVLANIIWSQASLHAKFGGVYPSLAKRQHEERIDFVIEKAIKASKLDLNDFDCVAITIGPGLAIALEVGIKKTKELSLKYKVPLIAINHIEGHILSVLGRPKNSKFQIPNSKFPALAFVASGKHTDFYLIEKVGKYRLLAETVDDALGEALDKAARMLGLGYPGGSVLEKFARNGDPNRFILPIPMLGREKQMEFSYSGLKTAMYKLVEQNAKGKGLSQNQIYDLAASFQDKAFKHVEKILIEILKKYKVKHLYFGGGVSSNIELRVRLRKICKENGMELLIPYSKKLCTDNAAMIGVVAYFKFQRNEYVKNIKKLERSPRASVEN